MSRRTEALDEARRAQMAQVLSGGPRSTTTTAPPDVVDGPVASSDQPEPTGVTAPAAPVPRRAGRTKPLRLSVDLAPVAYQRLTAWVNETGSGFGRRVTHVAVFRALLEELLQDPSLQARVRDRLDSD